VIVFEILVHFDAQQINAVWQGCIAPYRDDKISGDHKRCNPLVIRVEADQRHIDGGRFKDRLHDFGVDFFDRLRRLQGPDAALGARFRDGGLVDLMSGILPVPRFADGGPVLAPAVASGGRPAVINIGNESFTASFSPDELERLQRYATAKQVRSAGRKPSWYHG
jgi:hypothetical protein